VNGTFPNTGQLGVSLTRIDRKWGSIADGSIGPCRHCKRPATNKAPKIGKLHTVFKYLIFNLLFLLVIFYHLKNYLLDAVWSCAYNPLQHRLHLGLCLFEHPKPEAKAP
jgi:hypothetical protein